MTTLTQKFTTFEGQTEDNHTEVMGLLETMNENIGGIGEQIVILNNAMQAGFRNLLAAQGQSAACFPCPTPSIIVPPTNDTEVPVSTDGCQRAQWVVTAIQNILGQFDTLQSFNVVGTFNVLNDAISQIVGGFTAGDTIPLPSFPETVQLVGTYVNYAGERLFSGVSLAEQFAPLYGPLVTAVATSASAEAAQTAYNAVIDASTASSGAKQLFKAIAYNALWSYALNPDSTPDLAQFAGDACGVQLDAITNCTSFGSAEVTHGSFQFYELVVPVAYPGHPAYITGDYFGWSFQTTFNDGVHGVSIYYLDSGDAGHLAVTQQMGDDPLTFAVHTNAVAVQTLDHNPDDHPFVIRICPPE